MGRQIRPARVYQAVTQELNTKMIKSYKYQEPPWYKVMRDIPPAEALTRPVTVFQSTSQRKLGRTQSIYKPTRIVHEEDSLRSTFYKDHPWELARPRMILERDGRDAERCDWSRGLRQPGLPLTGECVVQRQLWLMHNQNMTRDEAYDVARKEFYALRQEEEIEKRVAREEARHVGAFFGKNRLQISQDLEDKEFERWKGWAGSRAVLLEQARSANYADFGANLGSEDEADDAMVEDEQ